jgi:HSP20 family protein
MSTKLASNVAPSAGISREPLSMFRKEIEDMITNFWGSNAAPYLTQAMSPALDVVESENAFQVKMDAPGLQAKDIDIQVHGNTLTLSGQRHEEKETKDKTFYRMERRHGSFSRTVNLPCSVNESEAVADYTNGVLTLVLPKAEGAKAKKIVVKGS